jgi:hypothetical protein
MSAMYAECRADHARTTKVLRANAYGTTVHIAKPFTFDYGHASRGKASHLYVVPSHVWATRMALRAHDADIVAARMNHGGLLSGDPGQHLKQRCARRHDAPRRPQ